MLAACSLEDVKKSTGEVDIVQFLCQIWQMQCFMWQLVWNTVDIMACSKESFRQSLLGFIIPFLHFCDATHLHSTDCQKMQIYWHQLIIGLAEQAVGSVRSDTLVTLALPSFPFHE